MHAYKHRGTQDLPRAVLAKLLTLLLTLALPAAEGLPFAVRERARDPSEVVYNLVNNFGKGRIATTGAEVLGNLSLRAKHAAAKSYDAIRNSTDDIATIARNTGISEARIARVKDHVFHKLHRLGDGLRRLDPNPRIANAWKRLEAGTHTADDLAFLRHELFESKFEGIFRTRQPSAHRAVERAAERAALRAEVEAWRAGLPTKLTPSRTTRDLFEIQQTGPYNYLPRGGGEEIWADGIRASRGHALEAKFVERARRSPFVNGSTTPPFIRGAIRNEVEDEFRRYAAVILDRNNPLRGLEVITNDPAAVPYFQALLKGFGLTGRVVVRGSR